MDWLVDLSWREYPSSVLIGAGAAMSARGIRLEARGLASAITAPDKTLDLMRGFRFTVVGLAIVALGIAWIWQVLWLFLLAVAIGGEELLESTIIVYALRDHSRLVRRSSPKLNGANSRPSDTTSA